MNTKFFTDDKAVSAVVGTLLMLAIVVAVAAITGAFVFGVVGTQQSTVNGNMGKIVSDPYHAAPERATPTPTPPEFAAHVAFVSGSLIYTDDTPAGWTGTVDKITISYHDGGDWTLDSSVSGYDGFEDILTTSPFDVSGWISAWETRHSYPAGEYAVNPAYDVTLTVTGTGAGLPYTQVLTGTG